MRPQLLSSEAACTSDSVTEATIHFVQVLLDFFVLILSSVLCVFSMRVSSFIKTEATANRKLESSVRVGYSLSASEAGSHYPSVSVAWRADGAVWPDGVHTSCAVFSNVRRPAPNGRRLHGPLSHGISSWACRLSSLPGSSTVTLAASVFKSNMLYDAK